MGFPQEACIDSSDPSNPQNKNLYNESTDHYYDYNKLKFRSTWRKMAWVIGFACIPLPRRRRRAGAGKIKAPEKNTAWLLAESGGCTAESTNNADPQSVHSSFRFNICSQVELESLKMSSSSAATVLMVNLDNGVSESPARDVKWWRIDSLNKGLFLPGTNSLIRFSFSEILSATNNFSEGIINFGFLWVILCVEFDYVVMCVIKFGFLCFFV